jgi:hypothetical protein
MTQYLMSVHTVVGDPTPPDDVVRTTYRDVDAFNETLRQSGAWIFAGGLHDPSTATVVRVNDGRVTLSDGPFAEAKEHVRAFWVVRAPDLDAALDLAKRAATACRAPVEVRPFKDPTE